MVPPVGRLAALTITTAMYGRTIAPAMNTHRIHPEVMTARGKQASRIPIIHRYLV
jgi:hypothetical protein